MAAGVENLSSVTDSIRAKFALKANLPVTPTKKRRVEKIWQADVGEALRSPVRRRIG